MTKLKCVYLDAEKEDGCRILVDRLWLRGISKKEAQLNLWLRETAPSNEARKAFDHVPERFTSFARKYQQELISEGEEKRAIFKLSQLMEEYPIIIFVYGAKDEHQDHVVLLKRFIEMEACK